MLKLLKNFTFLLAHFSLALNQDSKYDIAFFHLQPRSVTVAQVAVVKVRDAEKKQLPELTSRGKP